MKDRWGCAFWSGMISGGRRVRSLPPPGWVLSRRLAPVGVPEAPRWRESAPRDGTGPSGDPPRRRGRILGGRPHPAPAALPRLPGRRRLRRPSRCPLGVLGSRDGPRARRPPCRDPPRLRDPGGLGRPRSGAEAGSGGWHSGRNQGRRACRPRPLFPWSAGAAEGPWGRMWPHPRSPAPPATAPFPRDEGAVGS